MTRRSDFGVECSRLSLQVAHFTALLGILLACGFSSLSTNPLQAQPPTNLPSEAELPGDRRQASELPSEATLPDQATADNQMPGEDQIPGEVDGGNANQNDAENESAPLGGKTPILRLAFEGHTGPVRTLDISDGGRTLVTAGEDKDVHVWRRTDVGKSGWLHRRTIRWPVTRGPRGLIYTAKLKGDLVAFAGYGAFGQKGEIRIADAATGDLFQTLIGQESGHLSNVLSLAWSPSEQLRLASVDMEGRLILWQADETTGLWGGRTLVQVDEQEYGAPISEALRLGERRAFVPITFAGPKYLIAPRYVGPATEPKGMANWHLQRIDLQSGESVLLNNLDHIKHVRCLSATDDGRVLASCDWHGSIGIWVFNDDGGIIAARQFKPSLPPIFVDLSSDGNRLLVGTELGGEKPDLQARLQLWDLEADPPKLVSERAAPDNVRSGVLDDTQREAIVTQGIHVEIYSVDGDDQLSAQSRRLTVPARPVRRVAFSKQEGLYNVAFGWDRSSDDETKWDGVFDLAESKLLGRAPIDPADFLEPQRTAARWQVAGPVASDQGLKFQLYEGDQPRGMLPLSLDRHGWPTTICTLPVPRAGNEETNEKPKTGAVIVGSGGECGIYVYRASEANPPTLMRQFRDHSGAITSLSTSADDHYLVSGAADATISVWNLQDIYTVSESVNRWGCEFDTESGQLIASEVREDGPLYFRGVRGGDRLTSISWVDNDAKSHAESDPEKMRTSLGQLPFDTLVHFRFSRLGRPGPDFQSLPAWRPLASLFVDQTREWAFWTPAGYYDASFNGHQRFGWQINRSIDQSVEYYRAAQFRKLLERPDVMRRLLAEGSLPAAMRKTLSQIGPPPAEGAIVNQIESRPKIELLTPSAGDVIQGDTLLVRAEITVPVGATLVEPRAFVSGVPAVERRQIEPRDGATADAKAFQWRFRLPSDRNLQLEVLAATEAESIDRVLIDLKHEIGDAPRRKPRLHVLAIGASNYRDPQIQSLDFAAKAAGDVTKLFRDGASSIYSTSGEQLVDSDATRPLWRVFAQNAVEKLSQTVSPDDLVVMYLCGHGIRDRRTNQWYFVTSDARYSDLMNDRYDDCIAFSDLAALARLPCRKLAILDSCHSGAVQPLMRRDDLKSAMRFLQDDVVLTMTASEGDEEAAEQRETRMGRFTTALVAALRGEASEIDGDADRVSLNEAIEYVTRRVSEESEREGMSQHPTASPDYLLRTLQLPLTARAISPKQ